jgi:hypothetical protein
MRTRYLLATASLSLLLLAGCAGGTGDPAESPDDGAAAEVPCIVGTWQLDVADYAAQSEAFVLGLGLPIIDFGMTGAGTITFTADGLVATDIDLTTTGTIVAGDTQVPLNQGSSYSGSGDWAAGTDADTIDLSNWANVPDPDVPVDPAAPPIPAIDYTDIPTVGASCSESDLVLQGPDAPLSALWHR